MHESSMVALSDGYLTLKIWLGYEEHIASQSIGVILQLILAQN